IGRVRVEARFANHPGICVGYRLFTSAGSIAFFPDNESHESHPHPVTAASGSGHTMVQASVPREDRKLIEFLRGTDALIIDAQYDREEYQEHVGWGHGCLDDVVMLAIEAEIKRLFLFHHDPNHDDTKIDEMTALARQIASAKGSPIQIEAACEGKRVDLVAA